MTPTEIYKAVRDFIVVAAIGFLVYRIYTDGKNAVRADQFGELQKQVSQQADILKQWHGESTDANTKLAAAVAAINTAPIVVHDWLRAPDGCAKGKVLSIAAPATGAPSADAGGVQPEHGTSVAADRRDAAVAEFKRRWGTELAQCQADLDQWPQP